MLNKSDSEYSCLVLDLRRKCFQFFIIECHVNCRFVIGDFYYFEKCSLLCLLERVFFIINVRTFKILFTNGRQLFYSVMSVYPIQQPKSVIKNIHISLPLEPPSHPHPPYPSSLSQSTRLNSLCYTATSHLLACYMGMYVSVLLSHLTPSLPPPLYPQVCSLRLLLFLPCKQIHQYHFLTFLL